MHHRRIRMTPEFIKQNKLSVAPPSPDSLFWKLWSANADIANQALVTDFIQGINNGNLDPIKYGAFNVTDAYYCFEGADDYLTAVNKAQNPTLKAFLQEKYNSYNEYNQSFTSIWHISNASGIVPMPVTLAYSEFEQNVAAHKDPIYTLITMIPCEFLWYWLANQIAPPSSGNLYASWITGNDSPDGAFAMGNFIEEYMQTNFVDVALAKSLYSQAMNYELNNFIAATS